MLDVALRGGTIVDGTGAPRRVGDVGIADGRIVALGSVPDSAHREIDASGRIVAPGFVDIHTHVDAQVFWDPYLTPSSLHGVTTVLAGNCGFTLAPLDDSAADYLVRMLAVVEGMPLAALLDAVPLDWRSTGDYLDRIDGTLALNAGFSVGHSALRRVVMGADATKRRAEPHEIEAMAVLLRAGLDAGGLGFTSSWGPAHVDANTDPVPSRFADVGELTALAAVCREFDGTSLAFIPPRIDVFGDREQEVLNGLASASGRPVNWNVVRVGADDRDDALALVSAANQGGPDSGRVVALLMPIPSRARFSFATGFVIDSLPGWRDTMALPIEERCVALADPQVRAELAKGTTDNVNMAEIADWGNRLIAEVFEPELEQYVGRRVDELAAEQGITPLDALLDIACADGLRTMFTRPPSEPSRADWEATFELIRGGGMLFGGSDTGAHLDFTAYFDYPVYILENAVRRHGVATLEEAVSLLTDVPARLAGLVDRGRLAPGAWADVVVFDEATVASGELETRDDLPTGAGRLYAEPRGIDHVLVNGVSIVDAGALTGDCPGTLLRSGRDTAGDHRR